MGLSRLVLESIHTMTATALATTSPKKMVEFSKDPVSVFPVEMKTLLILFFFSGERRNLRLALHLVKIHQTGSTKAIKIGLGQKRLGFGQQRYRRTLAIDHITHLAFKAGGAPGAMFGFVLGHVCLFDLLFLENEKTRTHKRQFLCGEKQHEMRPDTFRECLTKATAMYLAQFQRNLTVARQPGNCTRFHRSVSK
jgi:hypothetical protein